MADKSFEELRYEDYLQRNQGSANASISAFGFGVAAPEPTEGLFFGLYSLLPGDTTIRTYIYMY